MFRHETVQKVTEAWVRVTIMVRTKAMIRTGYRTLSRLRLKIKRGSQLLLVLTIS